MNKLKALKTLVLLVLAWPFVLHSETSEKKINKPNIVLILLDDFGYELLTANGGESYNTPVMDKLAATGVRFEQCHAQPLCTPTRVQLMTGMSNVRNYSKFGHLDPSQKTFGNLLKNAGYATGIVGKWQLDNGLEGPKHFGFDEYCLFDLTSKKGSRYKNPGFEINGKLVEYRNNEYGPDIMNEYVLDFITRKKDTPFFLYYPMTLTHQPYDATPESLDYLESKPKKDKSKSKEELKAESMAGGSTNTAKEAEAKHFADMVTHADTLIGKLVDKLEELKLRENTLVMILGDNGTGGLEHKFLGRLVKGGKGSPTVWGTHVPGIANWPGSIASGKVCRDLIDTTDFLPTICEVTGTKVPNELKIDGRSFLPQLRGEKGNPREWLYAWFNDDGGARAKHEFVHDAHYKLYSDGRFYDIQKDDREKSPLVDGALEHDAKLAKAKLLSALKEFEGPRPAYFINQSFQRKGAKFGGDEPNNNEPSTKKEKDKH